ncbi:probable serine hydrolase [Zeugodacus cucurbitae]|uniref:Probable serine hydrolase n=1 Tax=Zeugodacus cucurbitae TaxID=28588 RepID=A0A0A1XGV6_ZEUCU|nr:probable serine hydrolase [Zeugodacus cucurbitae]
MTEAVIFTEIQIPVPWGHISGLWYGDQSIQPLIALHGWLDNSGTFAKLAPLLVETAGSVLCIDLPGHGHSSHLPAGILYHNYEFVRVLLRLMKAYNWSKLSLLGHSMGGAVAFYFATFYPTKVDVLISIDVVLRRYFQPDVAVDVVRHVMVKALHDNQRLVDGSPFEEPPSYTFAECERLLYEGSGRSMYPENCKYILARNLSRSRKYPDKFYFSRDTRLKYLMDVNAEEALSKAMVMRISAAKLPYMVLRGGASTNIAPDSLKLIDLLSAQNPNFETHLIADGLHHFHLDQPEVVANLIIPFLKRYRPLPSGYAVQSDARRELLSMAKL